MLYVNYHGKLEAAIGIIRNEDEAGDADDGENGNAPASVRAKDDTPKLTHPATLIETSDLSGEAPEMAWWWSRSRCFDGLSA